MVTSIAAMRSRKMATDFWFRMSDPSNAARSVSSHLRAGGVLREVGV